MKGEELEKQRSDDLWWLGPAWRRAHESMNQRNEDDMHPDPYPCAASDPSPPPLVEVYKERLEWQDALNDLAAESTRSNHALRLKIKDLETSNTIRAINADADLRRQREQASWDEDFLVTSHEHQIALQGTKSADDLNGLRSQWAHQRRAWQQANKEATEDQAGTKFAFFFAGVMSSAACLAGGYGLLQILPL